jgi:hypothetical protein
VLQGMHEVFGREAGGIPTQRERGRVEGLRHLPHQGPVRTKLLPAAM